MTKQFNLTGKTYEDAMNFYHAAVKAEVTRFHQDNDGVVDYDTITNYIDSTNDNDNDELFVPVVKMTMDDVDENSTVAEAKKAIAQNEQDFKLYKRVRHMSISVDVIEELMKDFVRNSFPDRELSNDQIYALTHKAYEDGHGYGMSEVVGYLDDEISMVQDFLKA